MKIALILLTLATSTSAFAAPSYQCQPEDRNLAVLDVFMKSDTQVSFATIVEGKMVPETVLDRKDSLNPPQGYTAFFAVGGCNQNGAGPHCFAIWQNTLLVSNGMLNGSMHGAVKLNGEIYRCEMLLK